MDVNQVLDATLDIAPLLAYLEITPEDMESVNNPPDRGWEVAKQLLLALIASRMKKGE